MSAPSIGRRVAVFFAGLLAGIFGGAFLVVYVLHWPPYANALLNFAWGGIWTRLTLVRWTRADGAR